MSVFVSNEWSWPLHRIVGGELTEEERRSSRKEDGEDESEGRETGEREIGAKLK